MDTSKNTLDTATVIPTAPKTTVALLAPVGGSRRVDLSSVLNNLTPHPFSYNDFLEFLIKEHSVENIDFWEAGMKYREKALGLYPRAVRQKDQRHTDEVSKALANKNNNSTAGLLSQQDEELLKERQAALRPDLEGIVQLFLTTGSHKEVNLPQVIVKRAVNDILQNKNYHPDVLKPVLEKTYEMMKTCTFPNFYKSAVEQAKHKNLTVLENGYSRVRKVRKNE